jgi:hypothetical protein
MRRTAEGLRFDWPFLLAIAFKIGLPPSEFWRCTWGTFMSCLEGYNQRLDDQVNLEAWSCSNIINVWVAEGDRITPGQLLGKAAPRPEPITSAEDLRTRMAARRAKARMEDV